MKNETKRTLAIFALFIIAFIAIPTFSACFNYAYASSQGFYAVTGVLTLALFVWIVVRGARKFFKSLGE